MTVSDIYKLLDEYFPRSLSCEFDNDGLMVCAEPSTEVTRILFALDATYDAIDTAIENGCQLLITHHPMIFSPVKAVNTAVPCSAKIIQAIRSNLSVISLHTRFDAGDGGVNDTLAATVGCKVLEKFGDGDAPSLGRIASLNAPMQLCDFAHRVKDALGAPTVTVTGTRTVQRVAFVGGDGKSLISSALAAGADTLVTGAASYNSALDASESGLNVIEAGHYHTEAPALHSLASICTSAAGIEAIFFNSNNVKVL